MFFNIIPVFLDPENASTQQVDLRDIRSVMNGVYGGLHSADSEESAFPMQQKVLLCSLMLILNNGKSKEISIGRVILKLDSHILL